MRCLGAWSQACLLSVLFVKSLGMQKQLSTALPQHEDTQKAKLGSRGLDDADDGTGVSSSSGSEVPPVSATSILGVLSAFGLMQAGTEAGAGGVLPHSTPMSSFASGPDVSHVAVRSRAAQFTAATAPKVTRAGVDGNKKHHKQPSPSTTEAPDGRALAGNDRSDVDLEDGGGGSSGGASSAIIVFVIVLAAIVVWMMYSGIGDGAFDENGKAPKEHFRRKPDGSMQRVPPTSQLPANLSAFRLPEPDLASCRNSLQGRTSVYPPHWASQNPTTSNLAAPGAGPYDAYGRHSLLPVMTPGPLTAEPSRQILPMQQRPSLPPMFAQPMVPPICPELVMPNAEAMFSLSYDKLMQRIESIIVFGFSGNALLRISNTSDSLGRQTMNLSMTPTRSPTLATIRSGANVDVVKGNGQPYGEIRASGSLQFQLLCAGRPVAWIAGEGSGGGTFVMHACEDNTEIARMSRTSTNEANGNVEESVSVFVQPGIDGVLMLCCVMGILCMAPVGRR